MKQIQETLAAEINSFKATPLNEGALGYTEVLRYFANIPISIRCVITHTPIKAYIVYDCIDTPTLSEIDLVYLWEDTVDITPHMLSLIKPKLQKWLTAFADELFLEVDRVLNNLCLSHSKAPSQLLTYERGGKSNRELPET